MRRLFLKIFLWYWLATALMVPVFVVSVWTTSRHEEPPFVRDVGNLLALHASNAVDTYERDGRDGLAAYLARVEQGSSLHTYLLDERGLEVTGRPVPPHVARFAGRASKTGDVVFDHDVGSLTAARPVAGASGRSFVLVAEMAGGRPWPPPYPPWLIVRALAVLLTAGAVCYALARYLTRRVDTLRSATRALAAGDLSVRVGASLGASRDELTDLGHDFDDMAGRLERFVASERRLLRDISHELRSPLARLGVAVALVRQSAGAGAVPELDRIELEAARLNDLVGRILTLTRVEALGENVREDRVDLAELVREIAADADFEARAAGRRVAVSATVACFVAGDAGLLHSAVENVVRNAVRYTADGTSVDVSLSTETAADGRTEAVVRVRDHGPGVPEASLADIFRPFYRVADGRERQTGGTGLGLAIVERAIRLHGGSTNAAPADGGGLTVTLRLPADGKAGQA